MRGVARLLVVVTAFFFGMLFAVGSILAALFEMQGFTAADSGGPRPAYLAALALALVASVGVPFGITGFIFPQQRLLVILLGAVVLVLAVATFGLALI